MPVVKGTHIYDGYLIIDGYSSVNIPTQPDHIASKAYVDDQAGSAQVATTFEAFTITINPVVANPSSFPPITTQAEATARGPFSSMFRAAQALPPHIRHKITFSLVDGQHNPDDYLLFGDLSRFNFGAGNLDLFPSDRGSLAVTSANGRVRVTGTSTFAVASTTDSTQFTLGSAPAFADDAYAGYHIRVVSGTGSGQVKSVRSHVGTTVKIAGRFSPNINATSVVEFVQASAWINMDAKFYGLAHGHHASSGQQLEALQLEVIDFNSVNSLVNLEIVDFSVAFVDCRFTGVGILAKNAFLTANNGIFDGRNVAGAFGLVQVIGGYFRAWSSNSSWLIRRSLTHGLRLSGGTQSSLQLATGHLFEGAIDNNTEHGLVLDGPNCTVFNATRFRGTGNGKFGVRLLRQTYYYARLSDFTDTEYIRGTLGEVDVDGTAFTYNALSLEPDKVVVGIFGSIFDGNQPLSP